MHKLIGQELCHATGRIIINAPSPEKLMLFFSTPSIGGPPSHVH